MKNVELLREGLKIYGIYLDEERAGKFDIYINMLLEWNKKINLTAVTEEKEIIIKHFLDSLSCVQSGIDMKCKNVIDIGTGGGFPGVPLKIVFPEMDLTLLDSLNKRVIFLRELTKILDINADIIHGRAEEYAVKDEYREKYDVAISRAVAPMNILIEYMAPFVKVGGYILCQKGPNVFDEVKAAGDGINILGGKLEKILSTDIYNSDIHHYIVKIKKVKSCPENYPRKAGIIKKKPLK